MLDSSRRRSDSVNPLIQMLSAAKHPVSGVANLPVGRFGKSVLEHKIHYISSGLYGSQQNLIPSLHNLILIF